MFAIWVILNQRCRSQATDTNDFPTFSSLVSENFVRTRPTTRNLRDSLVGSLGEGWGKEHCSHHIKCRGRPVAIEEVFETARIHHWCGFRCSKTYVVQPLPSLQGAYLEAEYVQAIIR